VVASLSIRTRLTLLYSGLLFFSLALFGTGAVWLLRDRLTNRVNESLAKRIQGVEDFLRRETREQTAHMIPSEVEEYAFTQPEGHLIEVRDEAGRVLLRSEPVPSPSVVQEDDFVLYGKTLHVRAAASLAPMEASLRELRWLLMAMAPVLLLFTGAVGYWISSRALAPVDVMTRAARSIGLADLSKRLAVPSSRDELSRLAGAWNEMLARLENSVARIQRFTSDAAHELRTPLTALRTTAELAVSRERRSSEYREALEQVVTVSERMSGLLDELLTLARGDTADALKSFRSVDLSDLAREACQEMQPLFTSKDVLLRVDVTEESSWVCGNATDLRRLLTTLLENALKYTPPKGHVSVTVQREGSEQLLQVADNGCGIPGESIGHIFDRFYRVDSSRDRRSGGNGLGLAIAQQIAQLHNTQVEVRTTVGQGSCFSVRFTGSTFCASSSA
jgi:two-component system heavy metal sensor histidine kinase CusS